MKTWICTLALAAAMAWPVAADELLRKLTLEQLAAASMPAGVQIETTLVGREPAAKITNANNGAVSVQLAEIPLGTLENTRLSYEATISSENAAQPAYLELWAVIQGQAYFSRALNDSFTGTQADRPTSTHFFLKRGEIAEAARLGIRFEGPGSVTMSGIELWKRDSGGLRPGMWGGILGSIFGISAGIWGSVASYYVSRGRARGFVLGMTATFATAGLIVLLFGALLWLRGAAWDLWFTCVLVGSIVAIVESAAYYTLRARFQQSEERRMLAMDMK